MYMDGIKNFRDFVNEELMRIRTGSSGSGKTKFIDTIWDDEPTSPKSASSGILLNLDLKRRENSLSFIYSVK